MRVTWALTVDWEIFSTAAMSALLRPSSARRATVSSRDVGPRSARSATLGVVRVCPRSPHVAASLDPEERRRERGEFADEDVERNDDRLTPVDVVGDGRRVPCRPERSWWVHLMAECTHWSTERITRKSHTGGQRGGR
jgi:hypothetical protein